MLSSLWHMYNEYSAKMGHILHGLILAPVPNGLSYIGTSANMGRVPIQGYNGVVQFQHWVPVLELDATVAHS